jgi:hypothetical protein
MTIGQVYDGVREPDIARFTSDGVTYTCFVWVNAPDNGIHAAIHVEQEDGQSVLLDRAVVYADEARTGGISDCPKVIAVEDTFVLHWITGPADTESMTDTLLHRSLWLVSDVAGGWDYQGTIETHVTMIYDVNEIVGSTQDFVLVHRSGDEQWSIYRVESPYAWADNTWGPRNDSVVIADRVMGIAADTTDLLVTWQGDVETFGQLYTFRTDTATGVATSINESMADLLTGDNEFTAVGHCRTGTREWMLVVEFNDANHHWEQTIDPFDTPVAGPQNYLRGIAWKLLDGSDASPSTDAQWCWNLHMVSRPWTWASGVALTSNVYVCASFKSIDDGQEWGQTYGYVFDLDYLRTSTASAVQEVYPKPVGAAMNGTFDGRPTAWTPEGIASLSPGIGKRMNHVSHVVGPPQYATGPNLKSVSFAHLAWSRLVTVTRDEGELEPAISRVREWVHYHEEPWIHRRDTKEPAAPSTSNYKGAPHRASGTSIECAGLLVMPGGVTSLYDGAQIVEQGFLWAPEVTLAASNDVGSLTSDGTYWYVANYAWTDRLGQLHRGPLSTPQSVTLGASDDIVTITVRTMTVSMRDNTLFYPDASQIFIEVWRTSVTGVSDAETGEQTIGIYTFRRLYGGDSNATGFQLRDTPVNDRTTFEVDFIDTLSDAQLLVHEPLPWQLNTTTLQWASEPPNPHTPLHCATVWQNRVFGVNPEDGREILWSDEILPFGTQYTAPEFMDSGRFRFDGRGEILALHTMDTRMYVFTRDAIYALEGEPGNFFLSPIADGIGLLEPRSLVTIPGVGVVFQAPKGVYLIDRSTAVRYIGADVEDEIRDAGNVRSAELLEDRHQVRFEINGAPTSMAVSPRVLIFDYLAFTHQDQQRAKPLWARTNAPAVGSASTTRLNEMQSGCMWRGASGEALHVFLQSGGLAIERTSADTTYADTTHTATAGITMDVQTGWLSFTGVAGFQVVHEIHIVTDKPQSSDVTVTLDYEIDGTYDATNTSTHAVAAADGRIRVRPAIRTCSAIRIHIAESGTVPQTENIGITAVTVTVGRDGGARTRDAMTG